MSIKVGISQRVDKVTSYGESRDALDQRLSQWVACCGFTPVPIPNNLIDLTLAKDNQPLLDEWLSDLNIGAILLSGGNDPNEIILRDLTETYLIFWAEKLQKPLLGICRGMQMLSLHAGSGLVKVAGHVATSHTLILANKQIKNLPNLVNSYHNLGLKEIPDPYILLAKTEDGNIEAIKHKYLPWEGWMWHPERQAIFDTRDQNRFKFLVESAYK